jgi:hypothetical protein
MMNKVRRSLFEKLKEEYERKAERDILAQSGAIEDGDRGKIF